MSCDMSHLSFVMCNAQCFAHDNHKKKTWMQHLPTVDGVIGRWPHLTSALIFSESEGHVIWKSLLSLNRSVKSLGKRLSFVTAFLIF